MIGVTVTARATSKPTTFLLLVDSSTNRHTAVSRTVSQTQTLILVPQTVTAACSGPTRTVTVYPQGPTITVTSAVVRTATDGQLTSYWTTTLLSTATCHYPSSKPSFTAKHLNLSAQQIICLHSLAHLQVMTHLTLGL